MEGRAYQAHLDSGSPYNLIGERDCPRVDLIPSDATLRYVDGRIWERHPPYFNTTLDGMPQRVYVVRQLVAPLLLGREYLSKYKRNDVHSIRTTGPVEDSGRLHRLSLPEEEATQEFISHNLQRGYIRPSSSSVAAKQFFVPKKDGTPRPVVDYRRLNEQTIKDRYPLPFLWEIIERASQHQWFTVLDGKEMFYHIRMEPESIPLTAFKTPYGMYEWTRMPMGLTNAPAECQRFAEGIIRQHESYCSVYIDDFIVYTTGTREEHLEKVRQVRETLDRNQVQINEKKIQLGKQSVLYLGVEISQGTVSPILDMQALNAWPQPVNLKELQQWLGLLNWYRPFIPGLAEPLTALYPLTGDIKWKWEEEEQRAFKQAKEVVTRHTKIHRFDPLAETIIYTDASQVATGALLMQGDLVIGILSKSLNSAERNYTTTEREMLAVVRAVRSWRHYIESCNTTVIVLTDHKALTQGFNQRGQNRRMNRWVETLLGSNVEIRFVAGLNNPADLPSRPPCRGTGGGG